MASFRSKPVVNINEYDPAKMATIMAAVNKAVGEMGASIAASTKAMRPSTGSRWETTAVFPFGVVLQHRLGSHGTGSSCSCRLMTTAPEQGVLLSWDLDPSAIGKPTYFFSSEWEPAE